MVGKAVEVLVWRAHNVACWMAGVDCSLHLTEGTFSFHTTPADRAGVTTRTDGVLCDGTVVKAGCVDQQRLLELVVPSGLSVCTNTDGEVVFRWTSGRNSTRSTTPMSSTLTVYDMEKNKVTTEHAEEAARVVLSNVRVPRAVGTGRDRLI